MSYIVKLCYLPLLNDNTYYFTQPFQVSKVLVEGGFTANNISFKNDEIMVTVDDTLGGTTNSNLFKSNYNCLLLYNDDKNYFEIYHITQISFIGGKQIRIVGNLSHYTIDKINVAENEYNYILQNRETLKSKCGFIRYGYAYDSVLKADGTVNIDGKGGTDIYKPVEIRNIDLLKYRRKLGFRIASDINTRVFDDVKSKALDDAISCWLYIYCEPKDYALKKYIPSDSGYDGVYEDVNFKVKNLITRNYSSRFSSGTEVTLPYGVIAIPITKESDKPLNLKCNGGDSLYTIFRIKEFLERYSPSIYGIKLSARPVGEIHSGSIEITDNVVAITTSVATGPTEEQNTVGDLSGYGYVYRIRYGNGGNTDNFIAIDVCNNDALELLPVEYSELYPFYPRGFDGQIVSKQEFENYNYNPYIKAHGIVVRLGDGFGGIRDFTPFDLGLISNELVFEYYEALTPDVSKIYITPKISSLDKSLLQLDTDKAYIGLVNNVDLSMPYSQDQLTTYLANNKNFFQQKMVNTLANFWGETERSANGFISSYFNKSYGGMSQAINKQSSALYDLGLSIYNTNITKDNLKSAPDKLNDIKSNFLWLLMIQEDLKPVIEVYTADDYTLKSAYNRFCEYGIKLDKFIDEAEIDKYINIYENTPGLYAHDKLNYKYIEGDVTLYGFYSWYLQQQNRLSRQFSNGVKLINISSELKEDPKVDYDIMLEIKEEEFNFE